MALRVDHATRRLTADLGRAPRVHELAQYLELPPGDVLDGLEAGSAQHATSLETPVSDAEDQQPEMLADTIGHVDDGYELIETTAALADGMALLPRLERRALILRMGKDMRQVEIARELGCSQMQVSRLLRRASARLHTMIHPQVQPPTQPPDVPTSN